MLESSDPLDTDEPEVSAIGQLISSVEREVRKRTSGQIRGLQITTDGDEIVIFGTTLNYYSRQLATHAALDTPGVVPEKLRNEIEVL